MLCINKMLYCLKTILKIVNCQLSLLIDNKNIVGDSAINYNSVIYNSIFLVVRQRGATIHVYYLLSRKLHSRRKIAACFIDKFKFPTKCNRLRISMTFLSEKDDRRLLELVLDAHSCFHDYFVCMIAKNL